MVFRDNECCGIDDKSLPFTLQQRVDVGKSAASLTPPYMYHEILTNCSGSLWGPRADTLTHVNTAAGYSVFEISKSTVRHPPTLSEYESMFDTPGVLKANTSILTVEQDYVSKMQAAFAAGSDIANRVAVITGCSSGMGFGLAVAWAQLGGTVYCNGRDSRIYDWHRMAATSDGVEVYVNAQSKTTNETQAKVAMGLSVDSTTSDLMGAYVAVGIPCSNDVVSEGDVSHRCKYRGAWLLPQVHYPMYSAQVGVDEHVFDRIHFSQVDIRNLPAMQTWIRGIREQVDTIHLLCLNAQTEVGASMASWETPQRYAGDTKSEYGDASQLNMTRDEFLTAYPTRAQGIHRYSNMYESMSIPWTFDRVTTEFGWDNVSSNTMVQLVSSIAATRSRTFSASINGVEVSSNGPSAGWFEYRMAKYYNEMHAELMKGAGIRAQIISPAVFSTFINIGWQFFYSGLTDMPYLGSVEPKAGKFYYPMTASEIHTMQVGLMMRDKQQPDWTSPGGYVGGASYGGVQYLGLYLKDAVQNAERVKMYHLSNPAQEGTSFIGGMPFGPEWTDDMKANSYCWDYANPLQSTQWLERYKTANDFSAYAEAYADISLHRLWS